MSKESEWREIVNRFESSGLSQREFSEREGLIKSRLSYWVGKFKKSDSEPSFVELPSVKPGAFESSMMEFTFPSGLILKIGV